MCPLALRNREPAIVFHTRYPTKTADAPGETLAIAHNVPSPYSINIFTSEREFLI